MEVQITPIQRRSLVRRVAPWALSLGLFGGGGWGFFQYATHKGESPEAAVGEQTSELSNQARLLFGNDAGETSAAANRYTASESTVGRYSASTASYSASLTSPGSEQTESSAAAAAPANPFAATPTSRYASPAEEPTADASPEVARGQNDDVNPLRNPAAASAAAAATNDAAETAANAFRASAPASTAPPAEPSSRYGVNAVEEDFANTFASTPQPTPTAAPAAELETADAPAEPATVLYDAEPAAQPLAYAHSAPAMQAAAVPTSAPSAYGGYGAGDARSASPPSQEAANPYLAANTSSPAPAALVAGSPYGAADPGLTPTPGIQTAEGVGRPGERGLEGAQSPSLAIQKLGPTEIQVGKKCTFAVRVKNVGQRTAHEVMIHDEIPQGTKLVGTAPRADVAGADVAWNLGTLSAGEERLVEMELIPTDEGELGSVATVTFAAQASARARCTRPQLALRLASQPQVMIGERQIVQVEVSNPGSGDATGVMIMENVPQGVTHEAGPSLEYEIGTLRAGETKTVELVLTAAQAGVVQNVMTARADANLEVQAACEFEVLAPGLRISVDGPQMRYLERPAKYTVSIENPGTAAAHDVQLVSHLPRELKFVSANNLGEYDPATHSVYWSLAELPASESGSVELVAMPTTAGDHTLKTSAKASQGLEDVAEAKIRVEGLAALTVEVSDLEDLIEVGGQTTYEIRVLNQGSKAASNVQIGALLTPGLRVLTAEGETRHNVQADRVMFTPLPQLPPRGESVFRVTVQATSPGDQRLRVQVASDDLQQPITEEESTRVYADQ